MDIVDVSTRSRMMAGIRSRDTKPEMTVRRFLHAKGFRFRLYDKKLPSKPDIVLPRYQVVLLVHGCFWHRHAHCHFATTPVTNAMKWQVKFDANVLRDAMGVTALVAAGWNVIVIWECALRGKNATTRLEWLVEAIRKPSSNFVEWPVLT